MIEQYDESEGWQKFEYSAADGLRLAARQYGWEHSDRLPVICLPGLTRNGADFHRLALHLSRDTGKPRRVFCPDYRGRGMSGHDADWRNYNVLTEAEDVIAGAVAAGLHEAVIVGTSRGGLLCFVLAAMRPGMLAGVVLNDVGPEIDARGLVRIRNYVDQKSSFSNWSQAANALMSAGQGQFPRWGEEDWEYQARLIFEERGGRIERRYDSKLVKTLTTINLDNRLPDMWPQFAGLRNVPILAIRGENSDLLSAETLTRMQAGHDDLQAVTVADQGHAPDLGSGDLPRNIATFVDRVEKRG